MGILTIIMGFAIFVVLAAMFLYLTRIEKIVMDLGLKCVELGESHKDELEKLTVSVERQFKDLESRANPPAHVSDPFQGTKRNLPNQKTYRRSKNPNRNPKRKL